MFENLETTYLVLNSIINEKLKTKMKLQMIKPKTKMKLQMIKLLNSKLREREREEEEEEEEEEVNFNV